MPKFPVFYPYRQELLDKVAEDARTKLHTLDITLGSDCNLNCDMCEVGGGSPRDCSIDIPAISRMLASGEIDQMFVCGIGESTAGENLPVLEQLLELCAEYGITCSAFCNAYELDVALFSHIERGIFNVLFQYNSLKIEKVAKMIGRSESAAKRQMRNCRQIMDIAEKRWLGKEYTFVATSTVPRADNFDELAELVDIPVRHGVFPLVAELERWGRSTGEFYDNTKLTDEQLLEARNRIDERYGISYKAPRCPSVLGGIHIDNLGIVTVDALTGLSCDNFKLQGDRRIKVIGDSRELNYAEICKAILDYRESCIPNVREYLKKCPENIFGGCGGNAREILTDYVDLYA